MHLFLTLAFLSKTPKNKHYLAFCKSLLHELGVHIVILDLLGNKIWSHRQSLSSGRTLLYWHPENELPSGIYQILLADGDGCHIADKILYLK